MRFYLGTTKEKEMTLISSVDKNNAATLDELEGQLNSFYSCASSSSYFEHAASSNKFNIYEAMLPVIQNRISDKKEKIRILEVGAGRSVFFDFMRKKILTNMSNTRHTT